METEREKKLEKYFHEDIAKKTGLFNYFLKTVEVYLTDGRVFVGRLEALDSSMGIILSNSTEYYNYSNPLKCRSKICGQVVIPGNAIIKCCVKPTN